MIDASTVRPGRILYMYRPTNSAIGIVQAMVNVPHDEPGTSRTAPAGQRDRRCRRRRDVDAVGAGSATFRSNASLIGIAGLPSFQSSVEPGGT